MKRDTYLELSRLLDLPVGCCPNVKYLQQQHPGITADTIMCIFSQEHQLKVIRNNHVHKARVVQYFSRYLAGDDILQISADIDFPPCMLVRHILEGVLRVNKQSIGEILKSPHLLPSFVRTDVVGPELVAQLQVDILRCCHADCMYSPYSDIARQVAGVEFELLLMSKLTEVNIPFWSESELRAQGYHKTPDVRLQVPVAVREPGRNCSMDGSTPPASLQYRTIHWIDSKATFGDVRMHATQLEQQYRTYVNRYGPGLVIYWFGFIDDLQDSDMQVMVTDQFPAIHELQMLPRLPTPVLH